MKNTTHCHPPHILTFDLPCFNTTGAMASSVDCCCQMIRWFTMTRREWFKTGCFEAGSVRILYLSLTEHILRCCISAHREVLAQLWHWSTRASSHRETMTPDKWPNKGKQRPYVVEMRRSITWGFIPPRFQNYIYYKWIFIKCINY